MYISKLPDLFFIAYGQRGHSRGIPATIICFRDHSPNGVLPAEMEPRHCHLRLLHLSKDELHTLDLYDPAP